MPKKPWEFKTPLERAMDIHGRESLRADKAERELRSLQLELDRVKLQLAAALTRLDALGGWE